MELVVDISVTDALFFFCFVCLLVCFGGGGGIHLKILIKIVLKGKGAHTYDIHMN